MYPPQRTASLTVHFCKDVFFVPPSKDGLSAATKNGKSDEESESRPPAHDEEHNDNDDEDEEDDPKNPRLIPRSSPVPRKRGQSLFDETAEYLRFHIVLSAGKKVAFADTTGDGTLVEVKEFYAFDSDDEEDAARWEEEEAKYRKPERKPIYSVQPEFSAPAGDVLLQAVRNQKVEVEQLSPVEDEPLAFTCLLRVLNISFDKAVYVRSTMDNWVTYFDYLAEYVQGSHDGDTDQFSVKLSFAAPYTEHGSRIEFVVRYETSEGDFWANNSGMNYAATLLLSYEEELPKVTMDVTKLRGIIRPPKDYSMNDVLDSEDEQEKEEAAVAGTSKSGPVSFTDACPIIKQPEMDLETAVHPSGPSVPPNQELPSVDGTPSAHSAPPGDRFPCLSSETALQTSPSSVICASESVQLNKSQPLPRHHCELGNRASEQPTDSSPPAPLPSPQQESRPRSDRPHAAGEKTPSLEASCMNLPTTESNLWPTERDRSTETPASRPRLGPAAEGVSAPVHSRGLGREAASGSNEPVAGSPGAEGEAPPSPALTENASVSAGVMRADRSLAPRSVPAREEKEDPPQNSPDTLLENPSNTLLAASEPQSEHDINKTVMPSIIFLSGVVSLSIVMQEPTALFLIGLLLVLHRL